MLSGAGAVATGLLALTAAAKNEEWTDTSGNRFRGEAAEVLGPLALFRTSIRSGRRVPLHLLSAEDCVRFYHRLHDRPARAADWARAGGLLSRELFGSVLRVENGKLSPAELKGRPEPECFILFFANPSVSKSWNMVGGTTPQLYAAVRQNYPGMVEAVFWAPRAEPYDQNNMAVTMNMPWLVIDYAARMSLTTLRDLMPEEEYEMMVVSRDGVPLFTSAADSEAAIRQTFTELNGLLALMQPANPVSWNDRAWYLRAIQPVVHATDRAEPVLVGDPLKAEALRQAGVQHFDADIRVAAGGRVLRVSFVKPEKDLKPEMAQAIGRALLQAVFVPAVENGKFVDGVYTYHFGAR